MIGSLTYPPHSNSKNLVKPTFDRAHGPRAARTRSTAMHSRLLCVRFASAT